MRAAGLALLLILVSPAAAQAAPARKPVPVAARDWSRIVVATPEGGFRMGNPGAPVKLIEYGSLTCSHCGHFAREGLPALVQAYVKPGKVSFEFRNFTRDAFDLAGAVLTNCAGPRHFFPLTERLFATQDRWVGKFAALSADQHAVLEKLALPQRLQRLAGIGGLDAAAASTGMPRSRIAACLGDTKRVDRLMDVRRVALTRYDLEGTPTFLVNGKKVQAATWAALEPRLKQPGQ